MLASGHPETERRSQARPSGDRRSSQEPSWTKRGPGNRKEEARGGGASQSRTHFPSRVRRTLKPSGGRNRERTTAKLASRTTDREPELEAARPRRKDPAREPKPAARRGAEPAGTESRISNDPVVEPEGPTEAARPRPEPPWERRFRLRAGPTEPGSSLANQLTLKSSPRTSCGKCNGWWTFSTIRISALQDCSCPGPILVNDSSIQSGLQYSRSSHGWEHKVVWV
jgi:hypothetical protein